MCQIALCFNFQKKLKISRGNLCVVIFVFRNKRLQNLAFNVVGRTAVFLCLRNELFLIGLFIFLRRGGAELSSNVLIFRYRSEGKVRENS